ncbi:hypothetical protein ACFWB2_32460 [Streptomyces virginiae]|uniref:hypothetical protein n=1 Tax=Streptomyces virginiae TaxID=1961 RepID=UPI0036A55F55
MTGLKSVVRLTFVCRSAASRARRGRRGTIIETGTDSYRLASTQTRAEESAKAG